ncbi:Small heat shock protein HSP20 protein [Dioscorea alata]|uniref:Small heat shock protein HSP20 protein n=1 Tax=Dioscorea alata TaxID=55571 RepID=A0ACB7V9U8_DIOAL|nr:Small heat shock protein HSP20 protein [Dioscorea alata]
MSIFCKGSVFDPFSLDVWDPFVSSFSGFFNDTLSVPRSNFVSDTKETPEAQVDKCSCYNVFKADLPGLKEEVKVEVEVEEGRVLQISGEWSKEQEEKNDKWHCVERRSGKFLRRFRLLENSKVDQVKAAMENGVVTVTVPKEEVKKPEIKSIEMSI